MAVRDIAVFLLTVFCLQRPGPPTLVKHVDPVYPPAAVQARIQGVVTVEATIGPDGKVRDAKVVQSIPLLDAAALAAVRQWEYAPTIIDGVAKPVIMTVKVNFSLVDPSTGAPARNWDAISRDAAKLALDDKTDDAIALVEKFIAGSPDVADAQFLLGQLYEKRARGTFTGPPNRRDLQTAAAHFARSLDLQTDAEPRFVITWKLVRMYGADDLNDPAQAERYARKLVEEHASRAESHIVYAQMLHERKDFAAAADVLRKGRAVSTFPIPGLMTLAQYSMEQVQAHRDLPREAVRTLLQEAVGATDAVLARSDKEPGDYRLATMARAMALDLQAERLAPDRQQRIALLAEAERWDAPIEQHKNGAPPPRRSLSPDEAADIEWRYIRRWNAKLIDEGKAAEALAAYERYLAERRSAIKATAPSRARMASNLLETADDPQLPAGIARRLFDEADALLKEAERLNAKDPGVIEARTRWSKLAERMRPNKK